MRIKSETQEKKIKYRTLTCVSLSFVTETALSRHAKILITVRIYAAAVNLRVTFGKRTITYYDFYIFLKFSLLKRIC